MLGSECDLKTHVQNLGYPLPYKLGAPKATCFGRLCNLTATLTAYIFGMKHDRDNYKGSPTSSQNNTNFGRQTASNWTAIFTPSVNSTFYFTATLRRRRSANKTQPHCAKRWTVNSANNLP